MDVLSTQLKQNRIWPIRILFDPEKFQLLAISVMWIKKRGSEGRKKTLSW